MATTAIHNSNDPSDPALDIVEQNCDVSVENADTLIKNNKRKKAALIIAAAAIVILVLSLTLFILIGKASYDEDDLFKHGLVPVSLDGETYGYVGFDGKTVIDFNFTYAEPFDEKGMAVVALNGKYGVIDTKGNFVIDPQFSLIRTFDDRGMAIAREGSRYGFINRKGDWVIQPEFQSVGLFDSRGLSVARDDNKYGYINRSGAWIVEPTYDQAYSFSEDGLALIGKNNKYGYINSKGEEVIEPIYSRADSFYNGVAAVALDDLYGYIDTKGKLVIDYKYLSTTPFYDNGIAVVCEDLELWYLINKKGEKIVDVYYSDLQVYSHAEFFSYQTLNGISGLRTFDGEILTESASFASFGGYTKKDDRLLYRIKLNETSEYGNWLCGYLNGNAEEIIEPKFRYADDFSYGYAAVKLNENELYGYIDVSGEFVTDRIFSIAQQFHADGYAVVQYAENGKFGIVNEEGWFVVPPIYDVILG